MLCLLNNLIVKNISKSFFENNTRSLANNCIIKKIRTGTNLNQKNNFIKTQKSFYNTETSTGSSSSNSTSSIDSTVQTAELIIHHHHEGIVELQLNKHETKNALSKKLIFEVKVLNYQNFLS